MTLFTNLDTARVNSVVRLVQSSNSRYKPAFLRSTEASFQSNDLTLKIVACVQFLIRWQNDLDDCKSDPYCFVLFHHDQFEEYAASQRTLNKLKRKLSRLFFEGLDPEQRTTFINKAAAKFHLDSAAPQYVEHMFRHQGDDAFCLEMMGDCMKTHLNVPVAMPDKIVARYQDSSHPAAHPRLALAVGSAAEHFPLASNTWNYPDQPKNSWSNNYSEDKAHAVIDRRNQFQGDNRAFYQISYWDNVVERSRFRENILSAKILAGNPLGNCGERSLHVFHRLSKQRKFDSLSRVMLVPGDHLFVISDKEILDAWEGAKIYPEELKGKLLHDYKGMDAKKGRPVLELYDSKQEISVIAYNLYPLEAFKKDSTTKHFNLIELLKQFHQIPKQQRQEKMIKALEIIQFIEQKLPLYPYIDPAVNELYDQMLYLTKKERKNGLKPPPLPAKDRCLINEALQNLDLRALGDHLKNKEKPDSLTIFHAMKACLKGNDSSFLMEIEEAGIQIPVEATPFTFFFDRDPVKGIKELAKKLSTDSNGMDITILCDQILQKRVK